MKDQSITYSVRNMRAVPTTGKVAEKNPDRLFTVHGEFHSTDDKGKASAEALTITQKVIDRETAASPLFAIDLANGLLTLPSGERGRKAVIGSDQDAIDALLNSVREVATEPVADEPTEVSAS